MINSIVVGRGSKRTVIDMVRDKETRRVLSNKIKSLYLFTTNAAYKAAKARGEQAA